MIIKTKDAPEHTIFVLETILTIPELPKATRKRVQKELDFFKRGIYGEKNAAYYIDFHFKDQPDWAIIHDLRLKLNGRVAQIDHLLINSDFEFYLLETKSFAYGIKITETGEFLMWLGNRYVGIPSPLAQSDRHLVVLQDLLNSKKLLPKKLFSTVKPKFRSYVLIAPKSRVMRPPQDKFDTSQVIKADLLYQILSGGTKNGFPIKKHTISSKALEQFAQQIVRYHHPKIKEYLTLFGISKEQWRLAYQKKVTEAKREVQTPSPKPVPVINQASTNSDTRDSISAQSQPRNRSFHCNKCGKPVTKGIVRYCLQHQELFNGKVYCIECQKAITGKAQQSAARAKSPSTSKQATSWHCAKCGRSVTRQVARYCLAHKTLFGGQVYCRDCQEEIRKG